MWQSQVDTQAQVNAQNKQNTSLTRVLLFLISSKRSKTEVRFGSSDSTNHIGDEEG